MKSFKPFFFALLMGIAFYSQAQISTPAASLAASFTQTIGLTDVTVEYSRPNAKGRTIFGADGLVPNDAFWRTGANQATKITFSDDVSVEGSKLAAGSYAILTKPSAGNWMVNFYAYEGGNWTSYTEKEAAASVGVSAVEVPFSVESFTMLMGDVSEKGGTLQIIWANKLIPVGITVDADAAVMASIERTLAGPTDNDFYNAGSYYFTSGKDLNKALEYVQKATKAAPRFWQLRTESLILAKMGKYKEAITVAEKSKALATEAGNNDYIKMNVDSVKEWMMK